VFRTAPRPICDYPGPYVVLALPPRKILALPQEDTCDPRSPVPGQASAPVDSHAMRHRLVHRQTRRWRDAAGRGRTQAGMGWHAGSPTFVSRPPLALRNAVSHTAKRDGRETPSAPQRAAFARTERRRPSRAWRVPPMVKIGRRESDRFGGSFCPRPSPGWSAMQTRTRALTLHHSSNRSACVPVRASCSSLPSTRYNNSQSGSM